MSDSTKRALRTAFQVVIALVTITPVLLTVLKGTPVEAQVGIFAAWVAVIAKAVNALEDAGLMPSWLKDSGDLPVPVVPEPAPAPVVKPAAKKAPAKKAVAKKVAAPKGSVGPKE